MKRTLFLSLAEALELHIRLIERFGGKSGVRDKGLLESALLRPQTGYYATLDLQAAALMQSLARNHAFVDGNKRMAFAATAVFLHMNGYLLNVSAEVGEDFLITDVIQKHVDIEIISAWLKHYLVPKPPKPKR